MTAPTDTRTGDLPMVLVVAVLELLGVAFVVGGLVAALGWAGIAIATGALLIVIAVGIERRFEVAP